MTNGEKIIEIFPNINIYEHGSTYSINNEYNFNASWWNAEFKEPTTENNLAQERYQDLIDYFGDKEVAKTILEDRKEFKAWLERLRWNVKRADELARELEQIKGTTKNDLGVNCVDIVELLKAMDTCDKFGNDPDEGLIPLRTPALRDRYVPYVHYYDMVNCVKGMSSVTPQEPKIVPIAEIKFDEDNKLKELVKKAFLTVIPQEPRKGHWIYKKFDEKTGITNVHICSRCGCPLASPYKSFCSNCGSDNREVEE